MFPPFALITACTLSGIRCFAQFENWNCSSAVWEHPQSVFNVIFVIFKCAHWGGRQPSSSTLFEVGWYYSMGQCMIYHVQVTDSRQGKTSPLLNISCLTLVLHPYTLTCNQLLTYTQCLVATMKFLCLQQWNFSTVQPVLNHRACCATKEVVWSLPQFVGLVAVVLSAGGGLSLLSLLFCLLKMLALYHGAISRSV